MPEPAPTVADFTRSTLLAVRLRPMAPAGGLAAALDSMALTVPDVEQLLDRLDLAGLVEHRQGDEGRRWRLTGEGRQEGERLLARELDGAGARAGVTSAYERFVTLNSALLRA